MDKRMPIFESPTDRKSSIFTAAAEIADKEQQQENDKEARTQECAKLDLLVKKLYVVRERLNTHKKEDKSLRETIGPLLDKLGDQLNDGKGTIEYKTQDGFIVKKVIAVETLLRDDALEQLEKLLPDDIAHIVVPTLNKEEIKRLWIEGKLTDEQFKGLFTEKTSTRLLLD